MFAAEAAQFAAGDKTALDAYVNSTGRLTLQALSTVDPLAEVALLIKDDDGGDWLAAPLPHCSDAQ